LASIRITSPRIVVAVSALYSCQYVSVNSSASNGPTNVTPNRSRNVTRSAKPAGSAIPK
jgi:hypothetical protein